MEDYSIFDRNNIPRPPTFAGMTGQGANAMFSVGGRWMSAGQKTSNGYLINSYNPESYTLGMSYQGVPVPVQMQASTVAPYTPQFFGPAFGVGSETEQDEKRMSDYMEGVQSYLADPSGKIPYGFNMSKEVMDRIHNIFNLAEENE